MRTLRPRSQREGPARRPAHHRPWKGAVLLVGICFAQLVWFAGSSSASKTSSSPVELSDRGALVVQPFSGLPDAGTPTTGSGVSATFGIGPAITKPGEQRPSFNYGVTPGAGATDAVEVGNIGLTPVSVSVYPTDLLPNPDGSASFGLPTDRPSDVGSWISLPNGISPVTVTVAARSAVVVPIKISVPFNAQPGDHVGGIIASLASFARNAQGDIVRFDQRVATRAFFRVSGLLTPKITIEDLKASYHQNWSPLGKGSVTISYTVHNRGNVKLAVSQSVSFSGLFGTRRVGKAPDPIPDLLPGGFDRVKIRINNVFPEILGTAHVRVIPSPVAGDNDPPLHSVTASKLAWTLPLVLILILIAVGLYVWYRRRPERKPAAGSASEAPGAMANDKVAS